MKLIQTSSFCMSSLNENIDLNVSCDVDPKLTIDENVKNAGLVAQQKRTC